jgi:hypothetical protein
LALASILVSWQRESEAGTVSGSTGKGSGYGHNMNIGTDTMSVLLLSAKAIFFCRLGFVHFVLLSLEMISDLFL